MPSKPSLPKGAAVRFFAHLPLMHRVRFPVSAFYATIYLVRADSHPSWLLVRVTMVGNDPAAAMPRPLFERNNEKWNIRGRENTMNLLASTIAAMADTAGTDGLSLAIGGTLGAAIVGGLVKIWTSKKHAEETKIPQPCDIHQVNDCITVKECNRRMRALEDRMDKIEARVAGGFDNILKKLDAMDQRSEDRAIALNRRIDPMMEKMAECRGQVVLMKEQIHDAWQSATVGGKK